MSTIFKLQIMFSFFQFLMIMINHETEFDGSAKNGIFGYYLTLSHIVGSDI